MQAEGPPAAPGRACGGQDVGDRRLIDEFTGRTGPFDAVLDHLRDGGGLHFDAVGRVSLPHWSRGRVAVVGDAASCLSLFGDGSSPAVAGAHTPAEELVAGSHDPAGALRRCESRHRAHIGGDHRGVAPASALMVPGSRPAIALRNTAARIFARACARLTASGEPIRR